MMRTLAEYVMRGRLQAISIALIGSWVPLLNQAALGLVTLRKGWAEGLIITLWASLPAFIALWLNNVGQPMALSGIAVIAVNYLVAVMLRVSISWSVTLGGLVAGSIFASVLIAWIVGDIAEQLSAFFRQFMAPELTEDESGSSLPLLQWSGLYATGVIGFWIGASSLAGVVVARWWQALLYNPGGFREEFHQLRLSPALALTSMVALIYSLSRGEEMAFWSSLFGLPLLVAGLGLMHFVAAKRGVGTWWLVVAYVILVVIKPLGLLVSLLGFADVWFNLRRRFNLTQ